MAESLRSPAAMITWQVLVLTEPISMCSKVTLMSPHLVDSSALKPRESHKILAPPVRLSVVISQWVKTLGTSTCTSTVRTSTQRYDRRKYGEILATKRLDTDGILLATFARLSPTPLHMILVLYSYISLLTTKTPQPK
ncbi:hypothetical protein HOY80DRAFT_991609 [Tuber brumale]|nr:hypothetical protein HOY80DRAFT_991609 [Tuber brumale]